MNKKELNDALRSSREEFMQTVEGLSEHDLQEPGVVNEWSVKDILFHLTMWEAEQVKLLWQASQDQTPTTVHFSDESVDEINAGWTPQAKNRTLEQVWNDFHNVRKQTMRRLNNFRDDELTDPMRFSWLNGQPLWVWIAEDTFRHDKEHAEQIQAWRRSKKS
jgi:hypothetical protein